MNDLHEVKITLNVLEVGVDIIPICLVCGELPVKIVGGEPEIVHPALDLQRFTVFNNCFRLL